MMTGGLMHRGYLALWRKIQDHEFYKEKRIYSKLEAWIDLLLEVRYKEEPENVILGMTTHECKYGESLKSHGTWGKRWGWSEHKVRRFFKLLYKMGQANSISVGNTSKISLINFGVYDPRHRTSVEPLSNLCRTSVELLSTEEEGQEGKKDKNISPIGDIVGEGIADTCPHKEIIQEYHKILFQLPPVKSWGQTSQKNLRSRWRESKDRQSIGWWSDFFQYISKSDFLMGRKKDFQASLGWIIGPKNFEKIINGHYENHNGGNPNANTRKFTPEYYEQGSSGTSDKENPLF